MHPHQGLKQETENSRLQRPLPGFDIPGGGTALLRPARISAGPSGPHVPRSIGRGPQNATPIARPQPVRLLSFLRPYSRQERDLSQGDALQSDAAKRSHLSCAAIGASDEKPAVYWRFLRWILPLKEKRFTRDAALPRVPAKALPA